ncbi:MAG: hypothetical protein M3357_12420 [Actinomycetota bacterium]|nr:hypothetical protein [Actinomycetota bacterium]
MSKVSVRLNGARPVREWATFEDPADAKRQWQVDVTFLASNWGCIYGCGCQGVLTAPTPERVEGCCSYGAHFTSEEDADRVEAAAAQLTPAQWQHLALGRRRGVVARLPGGARRTRLVEGACVFLNRPGFPAGPGCALHLLALDQGGHPMATKPDVCWQLPLRNTQRAEADGTTTCILSEFGREDWGAGGAEFAWWCTEVPEAFTAAEPVYRSLEVELRAMVGDTLYETIAAYLDGRRDGTAGVAPHPAVTPVSSPETSASERGA